MTTQEETWRAIPGYEGHYEVSNHGRVRSLDRLVMRRGGLAPGPMRYRGKVLSLSSYSTTDHLKVGLRLDGNERTASVHTLVLETFVGPRPDGMEACHYDGDPTNNRLDNLRWDTRSSNMQDAIRHGTHPMTKRVACPRGHLLIAPNLRPSQAARGHRQCIACHRAIATQQKALRKGLQIDLQATADHRYAKIMEAAGLAIHDPADRQAS